MKRTFTVLLVLLTLGLAAVYLFIPAELDIGDSRLLNMPLNAVSRSLSDKNTWEKWWPGAKPFVYNDQRFFVHSNVLNVQEIDIIDRKDSAITLIEFSAVGSDSTLLDWKGELISSSNPLDRITQYGKAIRIKKDISVLLNHLKAFIEKPENIYGLQVNLVSVIDSVLITTRQSFNHEPGVTDINNMVQELKKYILVNKAEEKNFPMLHVQKKDSNNYEAMVAIPVDRKLPETKKFVPKFLLKGGNILETEVRGGPHTIKISFKELENYRSDHKHDSPAIPYQLMITDRMNEVDTSKWVTKLYYPVY